MVTIVAPRLLNLAALPGTASESHIQPGNHLRVAHNPLFGLPVAPFILQRARLGDRLPDNFGPRRDIVFRDAQNQVLTLPITVQKGDEIRATIVQGAGLTCIWVGMLSEVLVPFSRQPPPIRVPVRGAQPVPTTGRIDPRVLRKLLAERRSGPRDGEAGSGDLRMRAFGPSAAQGPALVGERRSAPYTLGAPAIVEVVITGRGVITDMAWIAAQDIADLAWQTIDILNLPHDAGMRYLSVTDARGRSEGAMRAQAPRKRPLQETTGATAPPAAPAFTSGEESDRVHSLADPLDRDLDALIDGPDLPLLAAETLAVTDAAGNPLATAPGDDSHITINHLGRVLQGTLDPGVAAWLGYKGLDAAPDLDKGLSFYRVIGFFHHPMAIGAPLRAMTGLPLATIPASDRQMNATTVFRMVVKLANEVLTAEGRQLTGQLLPTSDYMMMAAVAAVDRRAVPEPPDPPQMLPPEHVSWLPAAPPAALREVECPLNGVLIGATLATEREQPTTRFAALNRLVGGGPWHIPLTLGLSASNDGAPLLGQNGRQGFIADRAAGPDNARYHIAQQDRFGRWSAFASADAAPGPRPKPPRPVVQGSYRQPALTAAATTGGTFALRILLPEAASLAPGSHPLSHVRLRFRHHNSASPAVEVAMPDIDAAVATAIDIDTPPPGQTPRRAVPLTLTGPILQPTEQRRIVITAVWMDTAGQQSAVSEPLRLAMTDPRPPSQMPIADVLLYSSRADSTGLAWIERSWPVPAVNPPIHAVYYTDEVRLLAWLTAQGRGTLADSIAAQSDRAARAGQLRAIQADFPDHLFERLADAVVATGPTMRRFRHAVSGSSRVLNAYKIAAEAPASGARPTLAGLDMVFYGVPNSDPPPRPVTAVRLVEPQAGEPALVAEITVSLRPGITQAVMARIHRTRGGSTNPLNAPLITTVPLSAPDPQTGRQTAMFRDIGTAGIAPAARLSAFSRYQWFAEVQGAAESGSAVPGLWSRISDPVGLATVPLHAPVQPVFDGFGGTPVAGGYQGLTLAISHPMGLQPTPLGHWRFEVLRAPPGDPWSVMASGNIVDAPLVVPDPVAGGLTPLATQFRVILYDPIGRALPGLTLTAS